ncbi:hypothetical protein SAMN02745206_00892 [Desulfacinum infernum DSM 9756]|uniref:Uncharacterized protein n=1 Tax=Desulfacinum infernum DSM 9756 TaxID=1121391 RepID=A0A1M4WKR4_9BACT|nr:hypothetical protein [Desulfacinum infernum]SHE81787.1 hypothetical protein SAMN02745206_00892 [Desulfacinum infernum DSM 9756]
MDPIIFRPLERILAVLIGGVSIYLGYRLFLHLPEKTDSQGRIVLPGNISVYLSRVGPGVFFALFGAAVVALSLYRAVQYEASGPAGEQAARASRAQVLYHGAVDTAATESGGDNLEIRRAHLATRLARLNRIPSLLRPDVDPGLRVDTVDLLLPEIKLSLLQSVWGPDWGNFQEFEQWVRNGAVGEPPPGCRAPADLFRRGAAEP